MFGCFFTLFIQANSQIYERLTSFGYERIPSSALKVGDFVLVHSNQRVPADMILFRTNADNQGAIFIRTDQLDGETDWKLRRAIPSLQKLSANSDLMKMHATMVCARTVFACANYLCLSAQSTRSCYGSASRVVISYLIVHCTLSTQSPLSPTHQRIAHQHSDQEPACDYMYLCTVHVLYRASQAGGILQTAVFQKIETRLEISNFGDSSCRR